VLGLFAKPWEGIVNGSWHYKEAELLLEMTIDRALQAGGISPSEAAAAIAHAQVHATLALAASNAEARALHWDEVLT
jgi:hypothetical protein